MWSTSWRKTALPQHKSRQSSGGIWAAALHTSLLSPDADHINSHWHWDHIGDPSSFPPTTALVVGQGFPDAMLPGYPANPQSPIRESDYM